MYSYETVKKILETAIDSLVDNFAREPYIHRCEHSLHCELYNMLIVHRALQGLYPLKSGRATQEKILQGQSTALIHKEWPETIPKKKRKRGNFDIAILDPKEILEFTVKDFTKGLIPPAFVVEMGLNYTLEDHLKKDHEKLEHSKCTDGYLIHLWQPHRTNFNKEEDLRAWLPTSKYGVAAVVFFDGIIKVKHLHDQNLTNISG